RSGAQQLPSGSPSSTGWPELRSRAVEEAVPQLGAVLTYGQLLAPLQLEWLSAARQDALRLTTRFGITVSALKTVDGGVEVDAGIAERFDLAVVAEGGVFAEQRALQFPQGWSHDYGQTAWVGTVPLIG